MSIRLLGGFRISKSSIKLIGKGELLPNLRNSFKEAKESIYIIGPWIDSFFVREMIDSLNNENIKINFIVRLEDGEIDEKTKLALNLAEQQINKFEAKSLESLHSKIILIDKKIFYLGSANWFQHSLNNPLEITIKGKLSVLPELETEVNYYWEISNNIKIEEIIEFRNFTPILDLIIEDIFDYKYMLLNDPNSKNRAHIAHILGETEDPNFLEVLCEATNDEDANVRRVVATALSKIGDQRAEKSLIKLLNDSQPEIRQYAANALGEVGTDECIEQLNYLTNDEIDYVQESAKLAISKIKKDE